MDADEKFMTRCLTLAKGGMGLTAPNPMVGAVIVYEGRIIGEGYHRRFGEAHAEANAIASVQDEQLLSKSTLYVNLEPCSHCGHTRPCAELIIRKRIPRVVIACSDPFPKVSGRGIRMLKEAGTDVRVGVLEEQARRLNRFFMTFHTSHRPYIILKWAQSADGFIDKTRQSSSEKAMRLSDAAATRLVHKFRSEVAAIMVGTNTAYLDNPALTVRHWTGHNPVRIFLDRTLRVPSSHQLLDDSVRTLVYTEQQAAIKRQTEYIHVDFTKELVPQLIDSLYERHIQSLLVEGGAFLHRRFIEAGLWDEAWIEKASVVIGNGVRAANIRFKGDATWQRDIRLRTPNGKGHVISLYTRKDF